MLLLDHLLSLIAPYYCLGCGLEGTLICEACRQCYVLPVPSRCYRCGVLTKEFRVCSTCRKQSKLLHVWVRCDYAGLAKRLLHTYKFERAQAAAKPIADLIGDTLPFLGSDIVITSVPTATARIRQRGYDHAALLAREIAKARGVQYERLLTRSGQSRQVGADRQVRLRQLEGVLRVATSSTLPHRVVLVDDMTTTGASLETAARCLRTAGVKHVDAVVFAQKQRE